MATGPKRRQRRHGSLPGPADPPETPESADASHDAAPDSDPAQGALRPDASCDAPSSAEEPGHDATPEYAADLDETELTWQVGVREVQKNFADVLRRLNESGEPAAVTNRRHIVAVLYPVSQAQARYNELLTDGDITPPEQEGDLADLIPLDEVPGRRALSDVLFEMRDEERS